MFVDLRLYTAYLPENSSVPDESKPPTCRIGVKLKDDRIKLR